MCIATFKKQIIVTALIFFMLINFSVTLATEPTTHAQTTDALIITPKTVAELEALFAQYNYTWPLQPNGTIPAIQITELPKDITNITSVKKKKALFIRSLLPIVLLENKRIRQQRNPAPIKPSAKSLTPIQQLRLPTDVAQIAYSKVDELPVSLVVAQAAIESGWGTSRFAREGNSLFGQWTYIKGAGITPKQRTNGKTHQVRAFASIRDSVRAYMQNINDHNAYRELRHSRAEMRGANQPLLAKKLANHLHRYSAKGTQYVSIVKKLLNSNSFNHLDTISLNTLTN